MKEKIIQMYRLIGIRCGICVLFKSLIVVQKDNFTVRLLNSRYNRSIVLFSPLHDLELCWHHIFIDGFIGLCAFSPFHIVESGICIRLTNSNSLIMH